MDFLRVLFLESLWTLIAFEVLAMAVVIVIHRRQQTPATRHATWIGLLVCVLLVGLQAAVETDHERLEEMVRAMAAAADEGDVGAIGERIDDGFDAKGVRKADLVATINQLLQEWQIDEPRVGIIKIEPEGDSARVTFRVFCDMKGPQADQDIPSLWRIRCIKRDGVWRMSSIEAAEIGPGVFTRQGGLSIMSYLRLR